MANLVAVGAIAVIQGEGLTSIWCSWAAVVSVLIFFQLVAWRRDTGRADSELPSTPTSKGSDLVHR